MKNVGWSNPLDVLERQSSKQQNIVLRQSIRYSGALVDVYRSTVSGSSDLVYGGWSGQKISTSNRDRTRIIGLPRGVFRVSKRDILSGSFEGAWCYALGETSIQPDDVIVEVGSQSKFIVVQPEVIGHEGHTIMRFRVASVFE